MISCTVLSSIRSLISIPRTEKEAPSAASQKRAEKTVRLENSEKPNETRIEAKKKEEAKKEEEEAKKEEASKRKRPIFSIDEG